jgi:hypothetical protein
MLVVCMFCTFMTYSTSYLSFWTEYIVYSYIVCVVDTVKERETERVHGWVCVCVHTKKECMVEKSKIKWSKIKCACRNSTYMFYDLK